MENMKAVQVHNGGPEVLRFEDAPRPTPESGELLIKVHAASVNGIDWKARAGYVKDVLPFASEWRLRHGHGDRDCQKDDSGVRESHQAMTLHLDRHRCR